MGEKGSKGRETRRKREYGKWTVEGHRRDSVSIVDREGHAWTIGSGPDAFKRGQALAAALDATNCWMDCVEELLPPEEPGRGGFSKYPRDEDGWDYWSIDNLVVPAKLLGDGKYGAAGWIYGVYGTNPEWIANHLDVSEQSVRQYLSDLRSGRRSE